MYNGEGWTMVKAVSEYSRELRLRQCLGVPQKRREVKRVCQWAVGEDRSQNVVSECNKEDTVSVCGRKGQRQETRVTKGLLWWGWGPC